MKQRTPKATKAEQRARALLEQTASASGESFFSALVRGLARALGTRFASLGMVRGDDEIECLALWDGEQVVRGARYRMSDTPCSVVAEEGYCAVGDEVAGRYPNGSLLAELGVRGYVGIAIRDPEGRLLGVLNAMHDGPLPASARGRELLQSCANRAAIELAQMRSPAALEASEALARGILESMTDAILVVRSDGTVAFHNGAACELFRIDAHGMARAALSQLLPELEHAAAEIGDGDASESYRRRVNIELAANTRDGETIHVAVTIGAFELAGERLRTVVLRNVERRRREEQRLRGYARALERANSDLERARSKAERAAAAKTEFLANMSHEIRTPMTAILGFTDILLEEEPDAPASAAERADALRTIRRNGAYLLEILNDILDFSKIEANRIEIEQLACSPRRIVAELAELMRPRAQAKGVAVQVALNDTVPEKLLSDPVRLRQILLNLIGNAVKFTGTGRVQIAMRYDPLDQTLEIDVEDTGIGIAANVLSEVFEPFRQGDSSMTRRFGGTGLGLAITKRLVERLGGAITATSHLGQGSLFRVRLPAHRVPAAGATDGGEADTPSSGGLRAALRGLRAHGRVLVVEDGPDNQRVIRHVLERAGYEVTIAENGLIGVELALAALDDGTPFSVVLMDVQMPVLDGFGATRRLRDEGYRGPIIALTAHALPSERQRCIEAGCDAFATKPLDRLVLLETIAQYTQKASAQ
ncbi:MAG TPA: ATP-binding protein [Myxococcota bacterium]|nr:ATP-binding protein [Myxococcota bacterium]